MHSNAQVNMIKSQLLPNEVVDDTVIRAMSAVSREDYVPANFRAAAYADEDIPLTSQRFLMKPVTFSRLLQLASIEPTDKALYIGVGCGYGVAVMAQLSEHVVAVESDPHLAEMARQALYRAHVKVEVFSGALQAGHPLTAPYNIIFIEGAIQHLPDALTEQLAEGGVLVGIRNIQQRPDANGGMGQAFYAQKIEGKLHSHTAFDSVAPLLPGFEKKQLFQF